MQQFFNGYVDTDFIQNNLVDLKYSIAGVDIVGTKAIAGPMVAVAYVAKPKYQNDFLPKKCTNRTELDREALAYVIVGLDPGDIVDGRKTPQLELCKFAIEALRKILKMDIPVIVTLEDPLYGLEFVQNEKDAVKRVFCVSSARNLANSYLEYHMIGLGEFYPEYNWKENLGRPTAKHIEAIQTHGMCPFHRKDLLRSKPIEQFIIKEREHLRSIPKKTVQTIVAQTIDEWKMVLRNVHLNPQLEKRLSEWELSFFKDICKRILNNSVRTMTEKQQASLNRIVLKLT